MRLLEKMHQPLREIVQIAHACMQLQLERMNAYNELEGWHALPWEQLGLEEPLKGQHHYQLFPARCNQ